MTKEMHTLRTWENVNTKQQNFFFFFFSQNHFYLIYLFQQTHRGTRSRGRSSRHFEDALFFFFFKYLKKTFHSYNVPPVVGVNLTNKEKTQPLFHDQRLSAA